MPYIRQNGVFFMAKDVSKAKSYRKTKAFTEFILSIALIGACGYIVKGAVERSKKVEPSTFIDNTDLEEAKLEADKTDPTKTVFEDISVSNKDVFKGDLILVNEDHQYYGGNEDLVGIEALNERNNVTSFTVVDYDYTILRQVYDPMVKMLDSFYKQSGNDFVQIYGSYRTTEFQQQLYEDDLAMTGEADSTRVAKPGFSEHETGYAFDLTETETGDYQGTGEYAWINDNCYKYGFIVRYTEEKEKITQIRPEPWHFRYVGIPHAYYMAKNDLCLEEYIQLLSEKHPYSGEHLEITTEDGKNYEVYFFASDDGAETTNVPVPTGYKYDISGNNVDGFIVTVHKDEKVAIEQEKPTEAAETTTESETTEVSSEEETENTEE